MPPPVNSSTHPTGHQQHGVAADRRGRERHRARDQVRRGVEQVAGRDVVHVGDAARPNPTPAGRRTATPPSRTRCPRPVAPARRPPVTAPRTRRTGTGRQVRQRVQGERLEATTGHGHPTSPAAHLAAPPVAGRPHVGRLRCAVAPGTPDQREVDVRATARSAPARGPRSRPRGTSRRRRAAPRPPRSPAAAPSSRPPAAVPQQSCWALVGASRRPRACFLPMAAPTRASYDRVRSPPEGASRASDGVSVAGQRRAGRRRRRRRRPEPAARRSGSGPRRWRTRR